MTRTCNFSLRYKIGFWLLLFVLTIMGTITYFSAVREAWLLEKQLALKMRFLARNLASEAAEASPGKALYPVLLQSQLKLNPEIIYIAIYDSINQPQTCAVSPGWRQLRFHQNGPETKAIDFIRQLDRLTASELAQQEIYFEEARIAFNNRLRGSVKIAYSQAEITALYHERIYFYLKLTVVFILLALAFAFLMSHPIIRRLRKLNLILTKISRGNFNERLEEKRHDEFGEVAQNLNRMISGWNEREFIENFVQELCLTIELSKVTCLISQRIIRALKAKGCFIFLNEKQNLSEFYLVCNYPDTSDQRFSIRLTLPLLGTLITQRTAFSLADLANYPTFLNQNHFVADLDQKALLVPIIAKDEMIGLFILDVKTDNQAYTQAERLFLATLIRQCGFAIQNALLFEKIKEQGQLKRELEIAHMVQQNLLPRENPQIEKLDIDGICLPAREVGGDYYDYFVIDKHTIGIAIADVAGKGISAAFYMAVVKGIMLSLTPIISSPKRLLSVVNKKLYGKFDRKLFITMLYAIIDTHKKSIKFARAGHNALIMRDASQASLHCLIPDGIGLGMVNGRIFDLLISEHKIQYQPGDSFIFYTDGISEAMNQQREEFGEERLLEILNRLDHHCSLEIRQQIIHAVNAFAQEAPQHDDITLVTVTTT